MLDLSAHVISQHVYHLWQNSRNASGYTEISANKLTILQGNSMSNHPMISPTISDLSETLHTASPLLVYCMLKVTAHFIGLLSRNSILNFPKNFKIGYF